VPAEYQNPPGDYVPRPGAEVRLPPTLTLRAVWTSLDGLVEEGEAQTRFRPQGDATHTYIHLEDDEGKEYTIELRPFLGRARLQTGWEGPRL
jgi:hypothetical protein